MKTTIPVEIPNTFFVISIILSATVIAEYRVGVGIADVTGPIAQIHFLGYANPFQKGTGLHLRQFARAFIIEEDNQRVVFVSVDAAMIGAGLRSKVLMDLEKKYGDSYNEQNLILSATHTHSSPGGFMMDLLIDISTLGFIPQTFSALRRGIVKAIISAHNSLEEAKIYISSGTLLDCNINRSPSAYLLNPKVERDKYEYDVDKELTQLKFIAKGNSRLLGIINWFPVHPTSMNNTNTLVSSDNVGYASILFEKYINKNKRIGKGPFVAAFASTNLGDVSPNLKGARCVDTGAACDAVTSTCGGRSQSCIAYGPGRDMFESTKIIAERLFKKALEILDKNDEELRGGLIFGHQYVDMPSQYIDHMMPNGTATKVHGCLPAMGYSFAAGTTDGPGGFDFKQGTLSDNTMWNFIRNIIAEPTSDDISCHHPKPIFIPTGRINVPYRWQCRIVSVQVAIIAHVIIAAVPGEFTTMAGRRLRRQLEETYSEHGNQKSKAIIAGLSNTYTSYIVTKEEYQMQRYEGASTIFGPYTLDIYLNVYKNLVNSLMTRKEYDKGIPPSDISGKVFSFATPILYDLPLLGYSFGECIKQPSSEVKTKSTVTTTFVSANPRNNLMLDKTYLTVEKLTDSKWNVVATDADWETTMTWKSLVLVAGYSQVTIQWYVSKDIPSGTYRIRHFGYSKPFFGNIRPFEGSTKTFKVI
ncbi:neutral ceramidase-like [Photinus pyralis]|uniref:Neutral ceramidase n=2 Tax=Photinus pyralis TaxID=7054 RepID=A0A1Y1LEL8_PHOPY|nr:neutral ceramidase-like [Photinus pyralis]XP_031338053.1 neutral ceramidase-like [Photinus pyralis]